MRGPTVLQVVEGEVPEVRGEVGQCQQPPGQCVPEEMGTRTVWEQPIPDDLRGDISTPRWPWYPGELYGAGLTSSVVCTILSTEEKYASHRNWVCCWNASTRSGRMQRTAEGICRIGGMGFSSQTPPPHPPPGSAPGAGHGAALQYLQEQSLAAHHGRFAPVDGLREGQLPAVAQQHWDAGGLHRTP